MKSAWVLLVFLLQVLNVQAVIIHYGTSGSYGFGYDGSDLPTNSLIELGTYEEGVFKAIHSARIGDGAGGFSGSLSTSTGSLDTTASGLDIVGDQLALKSYNGTTSSTPEFGLFFMDKAINSNWAVPSGTGGDFDFSSTTIDLADLVGGDSELNVGAEIVSGYFGGVSETFDGNELFNAETVPEPSIYQMLLVGCFVGFLFWRKRNAE